MSKLQPCDADINVSFKLRYKTIEIMRSFGLSEKKSVDDINKVDTLCLMKALTGF